MPNQGMSNPLKNKLLMYYLAGTGAALSGPGTVGAALGGMTQQQIQSESFMKFIKILLAGGGKFGMDDKGVKISAPQGAFQKTEFGIPGYQESFKKLGGTPDDSAGYNPFGATEYGSF